MMFGGLLEPFYVVFNTVWRILGRFLGFLLIYFFKVDFLKADFFYTMQ